MVEGSYLSEEELQFKERVQENGVTDMETEQHWCHYQLVVKILNRTLSPQRHPAKTPSMS